MNSKTRILTLSRVYLIGWETRGVRGTLALPHPIHQATYFSLVGAMSLGGVFQPHVAGGTRWAGGRAGGGGGGVRGVSAPHIQ